MKLSIITINYNNLEGLKKTVESVLAQTWRDFEWIIVDGGSTDGSREYIESLAQSLSEGTAIDRVQWNVERFSLPGFTADDLKNPEVAQSSNCLSSIANRQSSIDNRSQRFLWCSEPDKGVYNAMNKGVARSLGDYLFFLNSGDTFHNDISLKSIFHSSQFQPVDYVYCNVLNINPNGISYLQCPPSCISIVDFAQNRHIHHQGLFVKSYCLKIHPFDLNFHSAADAEFICFLLTSGAKGCYVNEISANFYTGGLSSTPEHFSEIQRAVINNVTKACLPSFYHDIYYLSCKYHFFKCACGLLIKVFKKFDNV